MKYKHKITIILESETQIFSEAESDLIVALQAQLEGLSDDHGISYENTEISTNLNTIDTKPNS